MIEDIKENTGKALIIVFFAVIIFSPLWVGAMFQYKEVTATIVAEEPLGKITDADIVPTSFNEKIKTTVKTEKEVVFVRGIHNFPIGTEAKKIKKSNGQLYISWIESIDGSTNMLKMIDF
tara:strand:- start:3792 stop:4151 length:360 start_codon:yes stop_codon:yes gene_type:complete